MRSEEEEHVLVVSLASTVLHGGVLPTRSIEAHPEYIQSKTFAPDTLERKFCRSGQEVQYVSATFYAFHEFAR